MAQDEPDGSYVYPTTASADPDRRDVLRNKFGIRSNSELRVVEYRATARRMTQIAEGKGPSGNFDADHLKAIHRYIFQDVYEWAGHTRNESVIIDGARVEPIGGMSKQGHAFLHGSRIERGLEEAFKPIKNPNLLRGSSPAQFAEKAGQVLAELNFVHPFREGNGRAQEIFIVELGRKYGHEVDLTIISKVRMIEASITTSREPDNPAMKHLLEDAVDPNKREALRSAFSHLRQLGEDPYEHDVRSVRRGEKITGEIFAHDDKIACLVTGDGIVVVDRRDLPEQLPLNGDLTVVAQSDFTRMAQSAETNTTTREQARLVPAAVLSEQVSPGELKARLDKSGTVTKSFQQLSATARAVFADWQPIVDAVKASAISGKDGEQIVATLRSQPESFGPMAGRGGMFTSRERREAAASRPLLVAAAQHHIDLVASIRKTAEQEKYATARRAKIEVNQPSQELMDAIVSKAALSAELKNELHQLHSAFSERFGDDLALLRNGSDLDTLAVKTGVSANQLAEARNVLVQVDKGMAREAAKEQSIEQSQGLSR